VGAGRSSRSARFATSSELLYLLNLLYNMPSECCDEYKLIQLILEKFRVVFRFLTYIYIWVNPAVTRPAQSGASVTCAHLNGDDSFFPNLTSWSVPFLACVPDWARGPPLLRVERGHTAAWLPDNCTRLADSLQQTVHASKFPTLVVQFTQQSSCTIQLWQTKFFNQNCIFLWNFHDFV